MYRRSTIKISILQKRYRSQLIIQTSNILKRAIFLALICFGLFSCNPGTYRPLFKSKYDRISDTLRYVGVVNSKSPSSDTYRIQAYDILSIRTIKIDQIESGGNSQSTQQSSQNSSDQDGFRVEDDGNVNLPVVGKVTVLNLTRKEATEKIQQLYKQAYFNNSTNSIIDVSVMAPKVTVLGEVGQQGLYVLNNEHTSLVEILGLAGGMTSKADSKNLKIIRGDKSNPEIIYVNLENLQSLANSKLFLQNKDVIYVSTDKRFGKYEKSQSGFGIFQSVFVLISTSLLIFTTFFK
jgi:polysaccharide export outer membrane protein